MALLIALLNDNNVIKAIHKSQKSQLSRKSCVEILDAFDGVEGARRHLIQLLFDEMLCLREGGGYDTSVDSVFDRRGNPIVNADRQ